MLNKNFFVVHSGRSLRETYQDERRRIRSVRMHVESPVHTASAFYCKLRERRVTIGVITIKNRARIMVDVFFFQTFRSLGQNNNEVSALE